MAALTDIDVGNLALDILTEGSVSTFDGNTKAQRLLKRNVDLSRESMLKRHVWTFATIFGADLTYINDRGSDVVASRRYQYAKPDDALRVLPFRTGGYPHGLDIPYEEAVDGIYTSHAGPLPLVYVANIVDPADMPAEFIRVWAADIAAHIAHALTQKSNMVVLAKQEKEDAIRDARIVNAISRAFTMPTENFHTARGSTTEGATAFGR